MVRAVVCHYCMRNALSLCLAELQKHCNIHGKTPVEDVMSQTDTLVFVFLSVRLCDFKRSLFILCLSLHMIVLSRCLSSDPFSHPVYFYECLQYLMEAKKAQQSLESTFKQLDNVSLVV